MKGKAIIPLVLGLVIGLIAVKFGVDAIRSAQGSGQSAATITAVRAKLDIADYQKVTPDLVELFTTTDPQFAPPLERIETIEDVVGRVTAKSIPARSPILTSMLAPPGTPAGLVGRIPPGFRAVSVKIDEVTSVAYQLNPGDWVDVTVVMDVGTGKRGGKETIAEVILQHVEVAAVGRGAQAEASSTSTGQRPAKSATLLVREQEVPKLHLAATRGKLTLSLRGGDEGISLDPPTATGSELTSRYADPEPQPEPTRPVNVMPIEIRHPYQVTVVRGTGGRSVERTTFESEESSRVLEVTNGMPTRSSSALRSTGSPSGPRATRSDFGQPQSDADTSGTTGERDDGSFNNSSDDE